MNSGAKGAENFLSIKNGQIFFSPNPWQMMTSLKPLDALIPKIPFLFFADFWVWVTSEARGSVSVGFWGCRQLSPFLGGSSPGAVSTPPPPPPQLKFRLPQFLGFEDEIPRCRPERGFLPGGRMPLRQSQTGRL